MNSSISPIRDEYIDKYLAQIDLDITAALIEESAYKDFVIYLVKTKDETFQRLWQQVRRKLHKA